MGGGEAGGMTEPLMSARGLTLALPDLNARPLFGPPPQVTILRGLDLELPRGQVTGIVGESGSGKSTLGRCLIRLHEPTDGRVWFDGTDITHLRAKALAPFRRVLQMIFQDPMSSLNPRHTVRRIVEGPLRVNRMDDAARRAAEALERARLPQEVASRFPHQLSGGQRQRVGIARAIALRPRFILADEIVSGLDVSTQAEILVLLEELVADLGLTMAFVSHDLSVIRRLCTRVVVMRAGEIVEQGPVAQIFDAPRDRYTAELRAAIPLPEVDETWLAPAAE